MPLFWTKERCVQCAREFNTINEWKEAQGGAYDSARRHGWRDECVAHMRKMKLNSAEITFEDCKAEALKHKTRTCWKDNDHRTYNRARAMGWFNECSAHMPITRRHRGYWTKARCMSYARQFTSKRNWRLGHNRSYQGAVRSGWLADCFDELMKNNLTKNI